MLRLFGAWIGPGLLALVGLWCSGASMAQGPSEPWQGPAATRPRAQQAPPDRPDQPVEPQYPTIQRRTAASQQPPQGQPGMQGQGGVQGQPGSPNDPGITYRPRQQPAPGAATPFNPNPPPVPFILSPEEQRQLDQALAAWEQRNKEIKRFECRFTVWDYDSTFAATAPGKAEEPVCTDQGELRYLAPDKGLYRREGKRPEHWLCDGRSMYQYDFSRKRVVEYPLPPEVQGKAISDGPLPFVFGAEANRLKQRYFLRVITPRDRQDEVWLEARPRFQRDALDFQKAELILKANGLLPFAIQLYQPGGKQRTVYQFEKVVVNRRPVFVEPDPFRPSVPFGWKKELDPQAAAAAQAQAARSQAGGRR